MAERVLITGGAGFVGLHLARRLLRDGADVTIVEDFSRGRRDAALADLDGMRVVEHDLTEPLPAGLLPGPFDAVYHLAAVVGVARVSADPDRVLRTNVRAAENLLRVLDRDPPGAVFLSSTSEVADGAARLGLCGYPTPEDVPFALAEPSAPRASYALSKVVTEGMFLRRADRMRVRVGRYYNVYGPRMGHSHVIPQFARRVLDRVDPFPLYGAHQSRAFCYVDDAVEATVALTRLATPEPVLANIGNDREETRIVDLAELMLRISGHRAEFDVHDPPPGSPERRVPDLTVLRGLVPPADPVDLRTGVARVLDWYGRPGHDR